MKRKGKIITYTLKYAWISHRGKVRGLNQDNLVCAGFCLPMDHQSMEEPIRGELTAGKQVFGVFDGMGGEERGEAAAYLAAKTIRDRPMDDGRNSLLHACREANRVICGFAASNGLHVSGTTAALLLFSPDEICSCNVGDSRIYRLHGGQLVQVSEDHAYPMRPGRKGPLYQYLGIPEDELKIDPKTDLFSPAAGDRYLICSDGLTDLVSDSELQGLIRSGPVGPAVQSLLEAALNAGGRDNITVILIEII